MIGKWEIVKVQISLNDGGNFALIYPKSQVWMDQVEAASLPPHVLQAVKAKGGKAYFRAMERGKKLIVDREMPTQEW